MTKYLQLLIKTETEKKHKNIQDNDDIELDTAVINTQTNKKQLIVIRRMCEHRL